jgi:hypothetical protein
MPDLAITSATARAIYDNPTATRAAAAAEKDGAVTVTRGAPAGSYRLLEVKAVIENAGPLATHTGRGAELRGNRQDVVWLIGDRDRVTFLQGTPWQRLGVIDGAMAIPGYAAGPAAPAAPGGGAAASSSGRRGAAGSWPAEVRQSGPRREVRWLVAVTGDTPLRVAVSSQKGGTRVATVAIR